MALREDFEKQGNWLFRWRSYMPLIVFPALIIALKDAESLERTIGPRAQVLWEVFCVTASLAGLIIRCMVVGYVPRRTSGRITKEQKAETLNTTGMYSIVRHPLYFGNFLIFLGMVMYVQAVWFIFLSIIAFWLYYERIMFAEEEFLRKKFGEAFSRWADETPAFIPEFRKWRKPALTFSFKNVLKREYTALLVITIAFACLDVAADMLTEGRLEIDLAWAILFMLGLSGYLILRTLRIKTKILHVEGR